jgi:flagellar biogenesis protein FliO
VSLGDDGIALTGNFLAVYAPIIALILIIPFVFVFIWLLRRVLRRLRKMVTTVANLFRGKAVLANS